MQNLRRVSENAGPVLSHLWTKVHVILRQRRRPIVVCNARARLCTSCFDGRYRPLKLRLSNMSSKKVVFGPQFVRAGDLPDFGHAFLNRTYLRTASQVFRLSVWVITLPFHFTSPFLSFPPLPSPPLTFLPFCYK